MKRLILALLIVAMPGVALGGTLFPGYIETGGFGTVTSTFSQIGDGEGGLFLGAGGGLILNGKLMVSGDLSLLANDIPYRTLAGEDRFIEYTLASLTFGYAFWSDVLVHPAISLSGGMGWLRLRNPDKASDETDPDADTTFQCEPVAHLVLNLTQSTRLALSGGYRWVAGINTEDFVDQDAEGAFAEITFSFGSF